MEGPDEALEVGDGVARLESGSSLLWFTFPDRWYEVAALYDEDAELIGYYTNLVRPPSMDGRRWRITDLFLDVWLPAGDADPLLLDRGEFEEARSAGWIEEGEADRVEALSRRILSRARAGGWPPEPVRRWSLERVPELRLQRDQPGLYVANLITNRIIAVGMYLLGAASITSAGFALATDALTFRGPARTAWLAALVLEAVVLLAVGLAGRLPATRRVRPREALTEQTLFWGSTVAAAAVLLVHDSSLWTSLLSAVYGTLALFLVVFAVSRRILDRRTPLLALAGLAVCLLALVVLL